MKNDRMKRQSNFASLDWDSQSKGSTEPNSSSCDTNLKKALYSATETYLPNDTLSIGSGSSHACRVGKTNNVTKDSWTQTTPIDEGNEEESEFDQEDNTRSDIGEASEEESESDHIMEKMELEIAVRQAWERMEEVKRKYLDCRFNSAYVVNKNEFAQHTQEDKLGDLHGDDSSQVDKRNTGQVNNLSTTSRASTMKVEESRELQQCFLICNKCISLMPVDDHAQCTDGHLLCKTCIEKASKQTLSSSILVHIKCPAHDCTQTILLQEARKILPSIVIDLLQERADKETRDMKGLVSCPKCSFVVKMVPEDREFRCFNSSCLYKCCRFCKKDLIQFVHVDCDFSSLSTLSAPSYWDPFPEDFQGDYLLVSLSKDSKEFKNILEIVIKSLPHFDSWNPKIVRVQNVHLWEKYALTRQHMVKNLGEDKVNEKLLFHGTHASVADDICQEGFDWRLCGLNGSLFGKGCYFARDASYSVRYCFNNSGQGRPAQRNYITHSASLVGTHTFVAPIPRSSSSIAFSMGNSVMPWGSGLVGSLGIAGAPMGVSGMSIAATYSNTINAMYLGSWNTGGAPVGTNNGVSGMNMGSGNFCNQIRSRNMGTPSIANCQCCPGASTSGATPHIPYPGTSTRMPDSTPSRSMSDVGSSPRNTFKTCHFTSLSDLDPTQSAMTLFVAQVLCGRSVVGDSSMTRPPRDFKKRPYNTTCDNNINPNMYVAFDLAQAYPAYLVLFYTN